MPEHSMLFSTSFSLCFENEVKKCLCPAKQERQDP